MHSTKRLVATVALRIAVSLAVVVAPLTARAQIESVRCPGPDAEAAITACTRILDGAGNVRMVQVGALVGRAGAYYQLKRYTEALADYDAALALDPRSASAYILRGNTLLQLDRLDDAAADYDRSLQLTPTNLWAWSARGNLRSVRKQYADAADDFTHVL
ncbi:MAG TPA: tetratricopeptide repeat protein, partial [Candidatus Elarobacter sp.]